MTYAPPFSITNEMMLLSGKINRRIQEIGDYSVLNPSPRLRKRNRISSIHSTCSIEANSLSFDQVSDIINGHRVLGPRKDIGEVKNAIEIYSLLGELNPYRLDDLLKAHSIMVRGTADEAGQFRSGGEGVYSGNRLIFMAPPPELVPVHMENLFSWLNDSYGKVDPLITSSVFHYELVFIHPFTDGNGRMARLWQTAILGRSYDLFHWIPLENRIEKEQERYYEVISMCDNKGDSTEFIEFMLHIILTALDDAAYEIREPEPKIPKRLELMMSKMEKNEYYSSKELMDMMDLKSKPSFLRDYLNPGLDKQLIRMEFPDSPRSRMQRYRLNIWKT